MTQYFCSLPNPGEPGGPKELFSDDPALIERFIKAEDRPGRGVYECINPLVPGARRRSLETVAELRRLYFDLDLQNIQSSRTEVIARLRYLLTKFVWVRDSGSGNLHVGIELKDPPPRGTPEYDRVIAIWKRLAEKLAADPAPVHPAALIRCLGTHNTKAGNSGQCHQLWNGGRPLDLSELEELDDLLAEPLLLRRHAPAGGDQPRENTERKPPVDVDARFAAMRFQGPGENAIHQTQLSTTASLLRGGVALSEAARLVLAATRAAVADDPRAHNWDWRREELKIWRMGSDFVVKNPELVVLLPDAWRQPFEAALAAGRRPDVGLNPGGFYFRAWKSRTGASSEKPADEAAATTGTPTGWHLYDGTRAEPPKWLIKGLLPETGLGIIPGQWGSYKTTTALDIALAVMTGQPFAGQYRIKRAGAVIYFALEGAGTLQSRLAAIARQRGAPEKLPFAWRSDCPLLTARDAGPAIVAHYDAAAAYFKRVYEKPTVLILIDTYSVAAGFTASGDDSDTAATQKTFNALRFVHKHTGAAVVVVDHFGKMVESGTRGSSNKEGNADAVLATLADKELNGTISNTRLAVRKQRDGRSGFEIPFAPQVVELGLDEDGDPITAVVLDWGAPRMAAGQARKSKDLVLLCTVLAETVAKKGFPFLPEPGGSMMQACHSDDLRDVFLGRRKKRRNAAADSSAPRMAYQRALNSAVDRGLAGMRNHAGQCVVWKKG
jgi:AAA domain